MTFSESVYYCKNLDELNNPCAEMLIITLNCKTAIKSLNNYTLVCVFNLVIKSIVQ